MSNLLAKTSAIKKAINDGLSPLKRPEPLTLVEWSNKNFYLSIESSYVQGAWDTLPFQVVPMNLMGNQEIEQFNFVKPKRIGYSQMIRAAMGYFAEHKMRHQIVYQPTDSDAGNFMKKHIEPMIRDVPVVKSLSPWLCKKHKDNTLSNKSFSNGKQLFSLGGKAAKNYREKSVDVVYYDELAAFDSDIEGEGSATSLGDGRLEGSIYPKSIRGSTPKVEPDEDGNGCQITMAAREAECFLRFYLPCPHCGKEQVLKWGGPKEAYGIKWDEGNPDSAYYSCEHNGCVIKNTELKGMELKGVWRCEDTGINTVDGYIFKDAEGKVTETPKTVAVHVWSAYNTLSTWSRIVRDWLKIKGSRSKLKTFINTVLGETWKDDDGEKIDSDELYARREHYQAEIPLTDAVLTCAIDVQDDRFEIQWEAWCEGEENFKLKYDRIYGDLSRIQVWNALQKVLQKRFRLIGGELIEPQIFMIDSGGHFTDEVYNFSRKRGMLRYIPIKGESQKGKPIVKFPRKRNAKGVYLTMIGTDTGKDLMSHRLKIQNVGEGYVHFPVQEDFDEDYFKHLTNERRVVNRGKVEWVAAGRNEPWDLSNYNLAGIRLLQQNFGVRLPEKCTIIKLDKETVDKEPVNNSSNDFIQTREGWI